MSGARPTVRTIEEAQELALCNPVLLGVEALRPKYRTMRGDHTLILTVNRGYV